MSGRITVILIGLGVALIAAIVVILAEVTPDPELPSTPTPVARITLESGSVVAHLAPRLASGPHLRSGS